MALTAPDLVRAAMAATRADSPTALARALRMTSYSAPRNIKRWLNGIAQPDYEATLLLVRAAGLLSTELRPVDEGDGDEDALRALDQKLDDVVVPRLEAIEAEIRRLAEAVTAARPA